ncbi:MAG: hypothetical protein JST84_29535 [Acidobacteria bacterium]|nr:hypothetical protein [Acidobacteriota bacterium]
MSIIKNVSEIRERARKKIEDGAVTSNYGLNKDQSISVLNEALATELVCVLPRRKNTLMNWQTCYLRFLLIGARKRASFILKMKRKPARSLKARKVPVNGNLLPKKKVPQQNSKAAKWG